MLFRRQGYAGTGTNDILALSKAPRGSLYHYFPRGKQQIAAEAVRYAGGLVTQTLDALLTQYGPASAIRRYGRLLAGWMQDSNFRDGCPISTTLLEISPESVEVTGAGLEAFTAWTDMIGQALRSAGVSAARARSLAAVAIAAIEGSLIMARVTQSPSPILDATREVAGLIDAAIAAVTDD